jgi:protein-S-isoprenylcysteine O-methyltransferase Ste14
MPMLMVIRQLVAILALPCTVAIVIPVWIARRNHVSFTLPHDLAGAGLVVGGGTLLLVGFALLTTSVFYFWSRGRGTLAPWDPPRRFVVEGPYRYVRNPMISGVIFLLMSEASILRSRPHAEWAAVFTLINLVYIPLLEEPMLAVRFGEPSTRYTRAVSRFVPRFRPWSHESRS